MPGNSWGAAVPLEEGGVPTVQIITEGSYGFRGVENALALTLIRSSFDPDPYPEVGIHKIRFAIQPHAAPGSAGLIAAAAAYTHPLDVFSTAGDQPTRWSFLTLESGPVVLAALKAPEDGESAALILRLYETEGQPGTASLQFALPLASAAWNDLHEQPVSDSGPLQIAGDRLTLTLPPYHLGTLRVRFVR